MAEPDAEAVIAGLRGAEVMPLLTARERALADALEETARQLAARDRALAAVPQLLAEWDIEVREHGIWTSGHSIAARMAAALQLAARLLESTR